jgi:predicted membrane chloride channel (bestrophin family)
MFKSKQKKKHGVSPIERRLNTGEIFVAQRHGQNVPLEVALFMSSWINTLANRKVIDTVVQTQLQAHLNSLMDALSSLERILTTPIPWSYNCHIWEVSWIYCLALPFQIIEGFRWVTIPATVITAYIVFGYGSIAEEIENPFGYDKNDLNLTYFCNGIIAKELDAITARPMANPDDFIFTNNNWPLGPTQPTAQQLVSEPLTTIRNRLAMAPARGQEAEARHSDV